MGGPDTGAKPGTRRLTRARILYERLNRALTRLVKRLEADQEAEADASARHQGLLLAHLKSLQKLADIEDDIAERIASRTEGAHKARLDLDAARAEILRRLALRAERG